MKQQWDRLQAYLKTNKPELLADLAPPATDAELYALEHGLGVTLPADFVECLKIHNGQKGESEWLFSGSEFLSSQRIMDEWTTWKELLDGGDFDGAEAEPGAGIQPVWWSQKWIPFTYNGAGDHLCLDLDPASGGRTGQVITLWHDDGARKKKAESFAQWFAEFVDKTV
ncbi:SMI1/KNR4 family protein [Vogesella indigofera]|uniref:SMI1/KNR4 family protein n=1 Tax=Vogesella indigofera TaxID=45465 RepID=UPI00234F7432|nr:SMI1/KNR4 family protein [Vogesella indigofera]MDC7698316.1 SMI1/KNR4 family protein [Vogesella indigofera]